MNFHEIYNSLLAGKTLQIGFTSSEEAESFRVALYRFKAKEDGILSAIGILGDKDKQRLSFSLQSEMLELETKFKYTATIQFRDKGTLRQYDVKIVEDSESGNDKSS